jgi:hypothetical protein
MEVLMNKVKLAHLLAALLLALFGCGSKTAQTAPGEAAPDWVKECAGPPGEWYCGSGASNAEAMGKMVSLIVVNIKSEYSREVEQTVIQRVEEEIKKSETILQKDKQKVEASTGNIEVAGIEFYSSPSGSIYAGVKKEDLVNIYSHKIKTFFAYADLEFERAEADTEEGNTKLALKRINAIKDTLENNLDSWVMILYIAGGRGSEPASMKKRDLLLLVDGLNREICKTAKLHWSSEQDDRYSNIAFSKLSNSKRLKMEKARCKNSGVSLDFKNEEPHCSYIHGLYKCSCKVSLSLASCEGVEHLLLENSVEGVHQKKEFALEKMQNNMKAATFWEEWEKEVKEWVPQCVN